MKNLDEQIAAALRGSAVGDELAAEPNLAEELIIAFRGRNHWTNLLAVLFSVGGLGVAIWSGLHFYEAEAVREQLLWGGVCLFMILFISFMKVWFWMEMHSNRVLREVKRVELLLLQHLDRGDA
ncbi:DUF6768 family protein [Synoicihabitans lomoniglobus]|uniref:Uncharacterized protein n=1 Tax=Synoicihabitans lomoniglobus TaxID=2909285 RepID=A0AAF0I3I9_9BACT|nr:hypothetical protein [Opitutaceae bacterium LMO-M01]WED65940.1 hypothetical protein PXH66_03640 [Opitutaceae bacterium LMO-M01]